MHKTKIKKIVLIFGTRPEAIKMAPIVKEFQKFPDYFETRVCVTAQHRHMLDQVLEVFGITTNYDLNIMKPNQDLFDITTKVLLGVRDVLNEFMPDVVLVHGDTTTAIAATLACFYKQIRVGHVEAGLRTYNLKSPWPEEMNRQLTDRLCDYYFAPTAQARQNLLNEAIDDHKILITGNTVIDALFMAMNLLQKQEGLKTNIETVICKNGFKINNSIRAKREYVLITGHRRENFGDGFLNICNAIKSLATKNTEYDFVYPVHLNPNVQKPVYKILSGAPNVFLINPLDYLPFVYLMSHCKFILTDSGGIQEEAPSLGKPVLVMRNTTERPEAIDAGTVFLIGSNAKNIIFHVDNLLNNNSVYQKMSRAHNPYGDGNASKTIVDFFKKHLA
jgi:UDP-N-acetylglucosamine 2-epimerase (non-hydrolysing)